MRKKHASRLAHLRWSRRAKQQRTSKETWAQRARRSTWVFVFELGAVVAGLVGFCVAGYGLWEQVEVNQATLREIEADALARAWTLLTTPASGNSGKVEAMEYLASQGQPLDGVDISCSAMGGMEDEECLRPSYLMRLDLSQQTHGDRVHLARANLSDASLTSANFSGAFLFAADLSGAMLLDANFAEADLREAIFSGAFLGDADFSGANVLGAKFDGANLSRTVFTGVIMAEGDFSDAWAWSDQPPTGLAADIILCVYDEAIHTTWNRPDPCVSPE